tara:strand:- start:45 stop:230 length:186 start_codon:yes stop_codon:yes gene_type:complete
VSPSLPVPFIKNLFLKEIISLKDVDTGERAVEFLLLKQLELRVHRSLERAFNLVNDWVLHA